MSEFKVFRCFTGYRNAAWKSVHNFKEANFSDFKRLVMALKINPQEYNWSQKPCKSLNNKSLGSNWSLIVIRIEQSEVYDKLRATKFWVFFTTPEIVTNLWLFGGFKILYRETKLIPPGFSGQDMKNVYFSSCAMTALCLDISSWELDYELEISVGRRGCQLSRIGFESEKSNCFVVNLLVVRSCLLLHFFHLLLIFSYNSSSPTTSVTINYDK